MTETLLFVLPILAALVSLSAAGTGLWISRREAAERRQATTQLRALRRLIDCLEAYPATPDADKHAARRRILDLASHLDLAADTPGAEVGIIDLTLRLGTRELRISSTGRHAPPSAPAPAAADPHLLAGAR